MEHWRGIASGVFLLIVGLCSFELMFFSQPWRTDYIGSADEAFAPPPMLSAENEATAIVIENPYGISDYYPQSRLIRAGMMLTLLLIFLLAGAVSARVGQRVLAWRAAVAGMLGAAVFLEGFESGIRLEEFVLATLVAGAVTYAGGGLAKLLSRMRTRAA